MKPKEIKEVLAKLGARTNKSLGQHFLIDDKVLADIVRVADIKKGETVLEIGPGLGVLTKELMAMGAKVIAIERDRKFAEYLQASESKKLTMVQGDAAKLHWDEFVPKKWKLVANLPYAITSLVIRKALTATYPPRKVIVLIQREVAERAIAKNGKQSLLSLMVALHAESASVVRQVWKGAFFPPPKVESAVLEIVPLSQKEKEKKWGIDPEEVMKLAKLGFAHPRKKLLSNLKLISPEMKDIFTKLDLSPDIRAEDMKPANWVKITLLTAH